MNDASHSRFLLSYAPLNKPKSPKRKKSGSPSTWRSHFCWCVHQSVYFWLKSTRTFFLCERNSVWLFGEMCRVLSRYIMDWSSLWSLLMGSLRFGFVMCVYTVHVSKCCLWSPAVHPLLLEVGLNHLASCLVGDRVFRLGEVCTSFS